jgi:hypothetical protein
MFVRGCGVVGIGPVEVLVPEKPYCVALVVHCKDQQAARP